MNSCIKIFVVLACCLSNSKTTQFIIHPVVINMDPQEQYIAFVAGPLDDNTHYPRRYESEVYVLDLSTRKTKQILEDKNVCSLCWRNNEGNSELWICIMEELFGFWPKFKISVLNFEKESSNIKSIKTVRNPDIISSFNWNPKGTILAGIPKQDFLPVLDLNYSVAISFSNGKKARKYSKNNAIGAITFWATEDTFFAQDVDRTKIMEFCATKDELTLRDVRYLTEKLWLFGAMKKQPLYRKDGDIYLGDDLLYDSDGNTGWIRSSDPYIAFIENSTVFVIDAEGKDIARKKVEKSIVIDISASAKTVYLLFGYEKIQSWNFEKDGPIETLFDVKTITE